MNAGARYGLLFGVVFVVARVLGPNVWTPLWIAISVQLACFAAITWTRTRLPFMTAGASLAAVAGLAMGLAGAHEYEALLFAHPLPVVTGLLILPALMFSEAWAHPDAWRRFRAQTEHATLRDMLLFRHIPDLRKR